MVNCDFCKTLIEPGTGKMLIMKDGRIIYFCSNKCEKNMMKLTRKPRETRWTGEYAQVKKKGTKK